MRTDAAQADVTDLRIFLRKCAAAFPKEPWNVAADRAVRHAFSIFPTSRSRHGVLLKIAALRAIWGAGVFDTYAMADHILHLQRLDKWLRRGDDRAVARIRQGHGIRPSGRRRELDLYSFATKYCHWHRPDLYPMYDYYVDRALKRLNRWRPFTDSIGDLREFGRLRQALDACNRKSGLHWRGNKRLDQAFWVAGRKLSGDDPSAPDLQAAGKPPRGL